MADHPPDYAPTLPQILVVPLPDAASFFCGPSVQGEVFVKGLGAGEEHGVQALRAKLQLQSGLPEAPPIDLYPFPEQTLYPAPPSLDEESTSTARFPTCHRFAIPLPATIPPPDWVDSSTADPDGEILPGTLNLSAFSKGEVRYTLLVILSLSTGQQVEATIPVEGTPQTLFATYPLSKKEVEHVQTKKGITTRLLLSSDTPHLGDLVHLGVEIKPSTLSASEQAGDQKGSTSAEQEAKGILRRMRRIRVEFYRLVTIHSSQSSSSTPPAPEQHYTLLHSSGKSLRYPGPPPLPAPRLLFTIPTAQTGHLAERTWGEINQRAGWHEVQFGVRVRVGLGDGGSAGPSGPASSESEDDGWTIEHPIVILPKIYQPPSASSSTFPDTISEPPSPILDPEVEQQRAREAYRLKGRDIVGAQGTTRAEDLPGDDLPPPFEPGRRPSQAGPSASYPPPLVEQEPEAAGSGPSGLPTFLESQAQEERRRGSVSVVLPHRDTGKERESNDVTPAAVEPAREELRVGRDGLSGELATWVEYDGYETFSQPPPSLAASLHARGSMDPLQPGELVQVNGVVEDVVARLGLDGAGQAGGAVELMEHLGLGDGTRVVDLQDDLPPGIDEPSLPALPSFNSPHSQPPSRTFQQFSTQTLPTNAHPLHSPPLPATPPPPHESQHAPPSFDASQAANAVGGVAASGPMAGAGEGGDVVSAPGAGPEGQGAPPGYDRGGLPPYSQG
ncbi:hypothetical protein L202_05101 [Cryptococcus amylolentus CBS 6039]|uniref:Uncharacterized protein n=1 Tax=Cryptococcus amylolentus CBS 6039 TaxID=1295533 RepID=A0A1E3HQL7_9TREE|nr:hypothetical protein L202_05101 [Cryptococcus amylolentus CBS 6039]ODN78016.1 hypothetical protein L202_05101 [Cryptococcus amylolentus CBS 6039]